MLSCPIYKPKHSEYTTKSRHHLSFALCENYSPIAASILEQYMLYRVYKPYEKYMTEGLLKNPYTRYIIDKRIHTSCVDDLPIKRRAYEGLYDEIELKRYDIPLLEKEFDKNNVDWYILSAQSEAIHILEKYPEHVVLDGLLLNPNPRAMTLMKNIYSYDEIFSDRTNMIKLIGNPSGGEIIQYYKKPYYGPISLVEIARNPSLLHLLFTWDYQQMNQQNWTFKEELVKSVMKPTRLMNICETYNIEFDKLMEIYMML
jgi:hypothetical protein